MRFKYLVSLFLTEFDFAPERPRESEHSVKQHSDHAVEQESSRTMLDHRTLSSSPKARLATWRKPHL